MTRDLIDQILDLLHNNAIEVTADTLEAYLKGAAAAPAEGRDGWLTLLAPGLTGRACDQAAKLGQDYIAQLDYGFAPGPAPAERLAALRAEMKLQNLAGLILPRTDEYQGEYISQRAERVQWLTGFSGSAGAVVVGLEKAAIFVDGRYTLQVRDQADMSLFEARHLIQEPPTDWIAENFCSGDRIGFDPWLHTQHGAGHLNNAANKADAILVRVDPNPIDLVWESQPAAALTPVIPHDIRFAGKSSEAKRLEIAEALKEKSVDAVALTATDSIAWLLNMRGQDVPNCPLPLSFAILHSDAQVDWFVDERKLTDAARKALGNGVTVKAEESFPDALAELALADKRIQADPATAPCMVFDRLIQNGAHLVEASDPTLMPKACKNDVEIEGTRKAHNRDGAALARFLHWVETEASTGNETELGAIDRLYQFRAKNPELKGLSFDTIAGAGPNGAVIHYRAEKHTNRKIEPGQLLLVDSGGQYPDGTTDVTRTIAIGTPSEEMCDRFTRVLKGHIALATAKFPEGVTGSQLDSFARQYLWQAGLDYDHGTGHGVGSFLNVHEGPQRIAKAHNAVALKPGMIISNEPGYYKAGKYGIRIENLVVVREQAEQPKGGERTLLEFETVTLAPIDRRLIKKDLLSIEELNWLNQYHARVKEALLPQLEGDAAAWLIQATAPI